MFSGMGGICEMGVHFRSLPLTEFHIRGFAIQVRPLFFKPILKSLDLFSNFL